MATSWTPRVQATTYVRVHDAAERAREATFGLRGIDQGARDKALAAIADALAHRYDEIRAANEADLARIWESRPEAVDPDDVALSRRRIDDLAYELRTLSTLPSPLGQVVRGSRQRSVLQRNQVRVPIGVIAAIYRNDPSMVLRIAGMLIKTGNALLLHNPAQDADRTESTLVQIIRDTLHSEGVPADAVHRIPPTRRTAIRYLLTSGREIDLVIPLLPQGIPPQLLPEATVPILDLRPGRCHIYLDRTADLETARRVVLETLPGPAEMYLSSVTVLVHADVARTLVPLLWQDARDAGLTFRGGESFAALAPGCPVLGDEGWREPRPGALLGAVVDTEGGALAHIRGFGTGHTEVIVARDRQAIHRFTATVDSATVAVNASPMAAANPLDPALAYATRSLTPRGPLGLAELTSTKWLVWPSHQNLGLDAGLA